MYRNQKNGKKIAKPIAPINMNINPNIITYYTHTTLSQGAYKHYVII
jgi:hypothetical protein